MEGGVRLPDASISGSRFPQRRSAPLSITERLIFCVCHRLSRVLNHVAYLLGVTSITHHQTHDIRTFFQGKNIYLPTLPATLMGLILSLAYLPQRSFSSLFEHHYISCSVQVERASASARLHEILLYPQSSTPQLETLSSVKMACLDCHQMHSLTVYLSHRQPQVLPL